MAFSLFSVVSLSVIYRLTINFPELPYTNELKNVESDEFLTISRNISSSIQHLIEDIDGKHTSKVVDFRYHNVIGTLVYIDIYCENESPHVSDMILSAIKKGKIGDLHVSDEGFELHVVRDSETSCSSIEFTCLDKSCIPADQRCDGRRDCPDGSDEHKIHGKCKQHQPIIYQTQKVVFTPRNGVAHLSAAVENSGSDTQVAWSKNGILLGIGSVTVASDPRIQVYQKGEKHFLMIENVTEEDDGTYKMIIQGMNIEADFEVRLTSDKLATETEDCPSGERACKSGHCLPVSEFCDRRVQCPDGDDEEGCTEIECKSNEFQCELTSICVPKVVVCDGWKDCHDGSDERNCTSSKKVHTGHKNHHHSHVKVNTLCHDGSKPEFSLHGSSYCWSNSVCPSTTECVHGLCCPITKTGKRSTNGDSQCKETEFRCNSGECIEPNLKCNRKYECSDGSDETTCEYYLAVQKFHAENQNGAEASEAPQPTQEIHHAHQAAQSNHIVYQEPQQCSDQEFRCPYLEETKCFHYDKLCDGVDDCKDGSDETNCDSNENGQSTTDATVPASSTRCTSQQFECKRDGRCIDKTLECNRKYDCDDGSDETECEYFKQSISRRAEEQVTHHPTQQPQPQQQEVRNDEEERRRQHEEHQRRLQQQQQQHEQSQQHHQHQQHLEHQQQQDEQRRRQEHEIQQQEQARREHEQHQQALGGASSEVTFNEEYDGDSAVGCLEHEFQCAIGECIDKRRVCDTRPDCLDASDEHNCSDRAQPHHENQVPSLPIPHQYHDQDIDTDDEATDIQITIFPTEKEVRDGRDVSFDCRARTSDNSEYPSTKWARVGGPLPASAHDSGGRLTLNPVSLADAGTYICVATHNGQTVEARATLTVVSYGPQEVSNDLRSSGQCMADEKACGNNECVKNEYVCDGEPDCRDRSDEANCPSISRTCEPNEFKCNNNKCVQKMWLCDGDDDCGDNSDELNCNAKSSNDGCKPTEFQCHDRRQCVPASFHCDGTNDCHDGSDEVGCVQPTVVDPPQTNLQVPRGTTFSLTCKAVAVPEPYINWRLNWGPVCEPPRCLQTSEGGFGTLTIHDAQPVDQGAYTCEAINVKGRVLATPDCIVRVVDDVRPPLPPPTAPPQRASCDTRGAVTPYPNNYGTCECKPQVTGPNCDQCKPGSFHLSEKSPEGCLKCFCFGITNDCRSSGYYRTKDRLMFAGDAEGVTLSDLEERSIDRENGFSFAKTGYLTFDGTTDGVVKYWRLPQRFLGDKVTSYGGKMEFEIEFSGTGPHSNEPMVVLKGNQNILVHRIRNQEQVLRSDSPVRITVETYETNYEQINGSPASREDLLMVLADLDAFLIRATHVSQQSSTSLGDVSWEIAVDRHTPDGLALEVEQCSCPPGYIGTSCEDCAPGYERSGHGPYLGTCVPVQQRSQSCGPGAVTPTAPNGQCQCKAAVTGPQCDRCAPNSFGLSPSNPQGCIPCFCSGVSQQCSASSYRRTTVSIDYSRGDRDQLELTSADNRQPFSPETKPYVSGQQIEFRSFEEARGQTLYWKLPQKFLGDKVTAYGGVLKYTFRFSGNGNADTGADVILRGNDITLQYKHDQPFYPDRDNSVEVKLFENNWQRVDGQQATREHLLMTLADLDTLLIRATYNDDCTDSNLISVNFEFAEPYGTGLTAAEVEQCICPPGYVGTSCEDCAPGYSRTGGGLYLGLCEKCECNGHASQCDKEYGYCLDCQHNTEGDQCERCKPGFVGDARRGTPNDCQPAATRAPCQCNNHSPRGCDSFGRCLLCEHSTEGTHCERCKKGYYGDATKGTPYDCTPCPCPGASDCYLDPEGQVACRICPAGLQGRLCNECAPGYTRSNKPAGRICEPIGSVTTDDITFIQKPHEALRVRIMEPKRQIAHPGDRVHWFCQVFGFTNEHVHLEWTKVGAVSLPPNAKAYDGYLVLEGVEKEHSGQYRCTATTITQYATDDALLTISRRTSGRPPQPVIDPPHLVVNEGEPAAFRCWVPGIPDCQITWHRDHLGGQLPHGVYQTGNALKIPQSQLHHAGRYICSAANQYGIGQSPPAVLEVNKPVIPPKVDPVRQTVDRGQPARFKCWVPGNSNVQLKWTRPGGAPLPSGVQEQQGILNIPRTSDQEIGQYVCTATDPRDNNPLQSEPVQLNVRDPEPQRRAGPEIDPPVQTVNENDPAQFRCWVPGEPRAQLKWTRKDGRPLPQGILERDGFLRIDRAQLSDAGEYECTSTDPDGNTQLSPPARLNVNQPQAPIQPVVEPAHQTVNEGEPSRIRCWVPGNPNVQLQWLKRGRQPLPPHARVSQGILDIPRTLKNDEDDYICIATDPNTNRPVEANPARINVKSPIRPVIEPNEQTIPEGSPFRIRCYVPGHPNVELSFRKASGNLNDDADENRGTLTVQSAELTDEGDYICTARDPSTGSPIDSTPATVHVTPSVQVPVTETRSGDEVPVISPPSQTVPEGEPATIRCHVSNPALFIYLTFERVDGKPLPFGSSDHGGVLTIPSATLADAGAYICHFTPTEKPRKSTTHSILNVTPAGTPPRPVATPPLLQVAPGSPARFHCEPNSATPARIRWGHGDAQTALPEGAVADGDDLIISSAGDDTIGQYVCTATNEYGSGESEPVRLEVTEDQEPPTAQVEPRTWNGKPGDRHQFRCIVTGSPTPKITWVGPNGSPLPHDVTALEPNILDFSNGRSELNGDYTCTATNPVGEASDHGSVNIGPSLTVKTNPAGPKLIVTVGEPLQVKCEAFGAAGDPEPEVEWLHDPGPERGDLPDDFKPVTISEQFIRHPSVGLGNAGVYTCKGSSAHATATKNIYIEVVEPSRIATVSILGGSSQSFDQGEKGELICTATGSSLVDRLEWEKVDDQLPTDVEEHNEPGLLHFPSFKNSYAGEYRCNGYRNNEIIASASVNVHSASDADDEPRVDIEPPRVRVVSQGDSIVLKCSVEGNNKRVLWWHSSDDLTSFVNVANTNNLHLKHADICDRGIYYCTLEESNYEIGQSPNFVIVQQSGYLGAENGEHFKWALLRGGSLVRQLGSEPTLEIARADPSNDFGVYRCNVEDNNGLVIGSAYTAVSVGQQDKTHAQTVKFDEKSDAAFTCPVYSVPGSKVEWTFETGELPAAAVPNGNRIEIKEFDDASSGTYICKVSFDNNVVEGFVNAQIFVPDTIIQVLLEVSSESPQIGERAWFDCKVTGDPTAVISWNKEGTDELPASAQVTGGRLLFTDLKEDDAGVYRCIAKTKAGPLQTRTVLNIGSGKRKRKHLGHRRGRRVMRHRRRNALAANRRVRTTKLFGSWF